MALASSSTTARADVLYFCEFDLTAFTRKEQLERYKSRTALILRPLHTNKMQRRAYVTGARCMFTRLIACKRKKEGRNECDKVRD